MTRPSDVPSDADLVAFEQLMNEAMTQAERFGHREHLHLTWLAVRRYGTAAAIDLVSAGIQRTARYAGAPQKYHATVSRAWVEAVAHHLAADSTLDVDSTNDFAGFLRRYPALLGKRLIASHYRSATLASEQARIGWVAPDLVPFPWGDPAAPVRSAADREEPDESAPSPRPRLPNPGLDL